MQIFDLSGKLIRKKNEYCCHGSNSFSVSGLSQGLYIVKLQSDSFKYSSQLVITGSTGNELTIKSATHDFFFGKKVKKQLNQLLHGSIYDGDILTLKDFRERSSRIYVYLCK
jgi:hypothetical protein